MLSIGARVYGAIRRAGLEPPVVMRSGQYHRSIVAERAAKLWGQAKPTSENHPYLHHNSFIASDGHKCLLKGRQKQSCCIPINGDPTNLKRIIVYEDWVTGCTLAADEPASLVLAAIDASNLQHVTHAARYQWPEATLVVAGDDRLTSGNPGATKARAVATVANALIALPPWPRTASEYLTDFNDVTNWLADRKKHE